MLASFGRDVKTFERIMKHCAINILMALSLLIVLLGCEGEPNTTGHATSLKIDDRYSREIIFDVIGVTVPIKQEDVFIRIEDPVSDVEKHQHVLLKELGVSPTNVWYSNPARHGRQMYLSFSDGKKCSFIWVLEHSDERITKIREEHEKYHALCRTSPEHISLLSEKIKQHGFDIDLYDYNEELAATIVEILSLHLMGVPFDQISGSELTEQARDILIGNCAEQTAETLKK